MVPVDPFTTQLRTTGGRVVSWNYVESIPEQPLGVWFTKGSIVKSNPKLIDAFIKSMKEAIDYLHAATSTGITPRSASPTARWQRRTDVWRGPTSPIGAWLLQK